MLADDLKMRNSYKELLARAFFPITLLWIVVVHVIDKYFFDGRFEKRTYQRLHEQFASEIQGAVPSLFADFGACIVSNPDDYIHGFDWAAVTVAVDGMLLYFSRCRGEFRVDVCPSEKPKAWRDISGIVKNSDLKADPNRKMDYSDLNDFGRFFEANFDVLRHEVSKTDWRSPAIWLRQI